MNKEHVQADLGASAFLHACGYQLIRLEEISPRRIAFIFADPSGNANRDIERYFAGAVINAERLVISIRELKSELRAVKDNPSYMEHKNNANRHQSRQIR